MFAFRLTFAVYKPGQVIGKTDQPCFSLRMFVEGRIDALRELKSSNTTGNDNIQSFNNLAEKSSEDENLVRSYTAGQSFGEECFEDDDFKSSPTTILDN